MQEENLRKQEESISKQEAQRRSNKILAVYDLICMQWKGNCNLPSKTETFIAIPYVLNAVSKSRLLPSSFNLLTLSFIIKFQEL